MRLFIFALVLICSTLAFAEAVTYSEDTPSGGATVFGFAGKRTSFEVCTNGADIAFKIQYKVDSTTWTDFQPDAGGGSDTYPLFSGDCWSNVFPRYASAADSTRVLVTPVATTDVLVVAR